jgi:hypothetical protein
MAFYKVLKGRSISVSGVRYEEGETVWLSSFEANSLAASISLTQVPAIENVGTFNFSVPRGSDFSHSIGMGVKSLEIKEFTLANPLVIKTEVAHGLTTGSRVYLFAYRSTGISRDVFLSDIYPITKISADTFSVVFDGTLIPLPDVGFVDYLEDISSSSFSAKLYEPLRLKKTIAIEGVAETKVGSKTVRLTKLTDPGLLAVGDFLTVDGAFDRNKIMGISSTADLAANVVVETASSTEVSDSTCFAERDVLDPYQTGLFAKNMGVSVDYDRSEIRLDLSFDPLLAFSNYLYELIETNAGSSEVIMKGNLIYD